MQTLRLAVVSDSHLVPPGMPTSGSFNNRLEFETALPRLEAALRRCAEEAPDAVVALGDIANFGDDASLDVAVERFAASGTTTWLVGGNHDTKGRGGGWALQEAAERIAAPQVRVPPVAGVPWGDVGLAGVALSHQDGGYRARSGDPLGRDIPTDQPLLVLSHFPLLSLEREVLAAGWNYAGDLNELDEVVRPLIDRSGPTIVLHGHLHLGASAVQDRLLQIGCPPLIEAPFQITTISIAVHAGGALHVAVRREQIWPTDGVGAWPRLVPAWQAWRWDNGTWLDVDPEATLVRP